MIIATSDNRTIVGLHEGDNNVLDRLIRWYPVQTSCMNYTLNMLKDAMQLFNDSRLCVLPIGRPRHVWHPHLTLEHRTNEHLFVRVEMHHLYLTACGQSTRTDIVIDTLEHMLVGRPSHNHWSIVAFRPTGNQDVYINHANNLPPWFWLWTALPPAPPTPSRSVLEIEPILKGFKRL